MANKRLYSLSRVVGKNQKIVSSGIIITPEQRKALEPNSPTFTNEVEAIFATISKIMDHPKRGLSAIHYVEIMIKSPSQEFFDEAYAIFNKLYADFFKDIPEDEMPARKAYGVVALPMNATIEINFQAIIYG